MSGATRARAAHDAGTKAETSAAWSKPTPLGEHLLPVPAFDAALLPKDLKPWITDIAHRMQVPIDLVAAAAMCALSVVATGARTVHPKRHDPWRVYPILWGVTIAPPGNMKTPAMKQVTRPLEVLEAREREAFAGKQADRELAGMVAAAKEQHLKDKIKKAVKDGDLLDYSTLARELRSEESPPRARRFITQDPTVEKIADLVDRGPKHRSHPLGVLRDELLGLFHTFERDGREGDRDFYLEGWSAANKATDRVGRGEVFTRDLCLILYGNATPGPFEAYVREATKHAGADGFLQRLQLMVYPDPLPSWVHVDSHADRLAERTATAVFERLASINEEDEDGKPPALRFTSEAQDIFDVWLCTLEERLRSGGEHAALVSHFSKYRSLMPALALVCHLASAAGAEHAPISAWAAQQAIAWCKHLAAHAERIYNIAADPARNAARAIVERISKGQCEGTVKVRDLQRQLTGFDAEEVKQGVALLAELDWLRTRQVKPSDSGGRPSDVVDINPRGKAARPAERAS